MIQLSTRAARTAGFALAALLSFSCGDDTAIGGSNQGGEGGVRPPDGGGGQAQLGGGGGGGAPPSTGGGGMGEGGTGGEPMPAPPGPPGNALVSAGDRVTSENYTLVFTMGQSTLNQNKMTSSSYRLQGGLIGATGSLP